MAATLTERLSTAAVLSWGGTTILKVVDYAFGGTAPAEDVTGQEDGGQRDYIAGLRELDLATFKIVWDHTDTSHALLNTDFIAGTKKAASLTTPDGIVYVFDAVIEDLSEAAPLGSAITADLTLALYDRDTIDATTGL